MTEIPAWLVDDEKKHRKRPVPVTKEMVEEYKQKWREINARPVRRVAEAKARKKRRVRQSWHLIETPNLRANVWKADVTFL